MCENNSQNQRNALSKQVELQMAYVISEKIIFSRNRKWDEVFIYTELVEYKGQQSISG
jgi:hypothetical protein